MSPLPRGANVSLSRENPGLDEIDVLIEWGTVDPAFDSVLSMAAILAGPDGKAASAEDLVYFNQLQGPDDAAGWAPVQNGERVRVKLSAVPEGIERIHLALYIDAVPSSVPRTLRQLPQCVVTVAHALTTRSIVSTENLVGGFGTETASVVAELYRRRGEWKFRVVAQGYAAGLRGLLEDLGVPR
ncbi:MAG: TerD family protein [Arthrobacter sp.]|jgi:tellurium resistance protein TerD|nr:TerD family protein [Arthrobacter sp.]